MHRFSRPGRLEEIDSEEERGLANGLMFAGAYAGQAVGGSLVLTLAAVTGFKPTFFFVAGCILAVTVFVALPMRETKAEEPAKRRTGSLAVIRDDIVSNECSRSTWSVRRSQRRISAG